MAAGPLLSIVVIPLIGHDALAKCIDRLPLAGLECIVVLREAMGAVEAWQRRYPSVSFLNAANKPVPLRRQYGLRVAGGDVVGFIEDTSLPDEGWCAAARSAFADPLTAAAGGPVTIAAALPHRYRALAASEYGAFAAEPCPGPVAASRVPGNNMAFRRVDLIEAMRATDDGIFEGAVCAAMLARGRRVVYHPKMSVTYAVCDRHNAALATRLHHGRIYAGQARGRAWESRLAHLAKAPLLPIVLTARAMSSLRGPVDPKAILPVLLWLLLMESAWAIGEAIGAVSGVGKSIDQWR